ncbi:hypothetical protein PG614_02310 [Riemerella anatipestifer]|nr:hypothetical protein [Riemerella anatipestifer]MDY3532673.1 hypothetical protein [Riemerella anatipestifer]MDY3534773.1 hypothetical protein [Riemerella anatipestifer]
MSKEIIQNDIEAIRNETEMYGNTRERVASILTKLNQEKLDAENIPTNIATIDENGKVGTAYTKEQIDTKLEIAESYLHGRLEEHYDFIEDKLPKSESNISTPTVEFKYIYLTNEANETRRMLAGDLGKNLANSKPNNTPNSGINLVTPWYLDTNGIPLFMRGLPDKSNDTTFNKMVVRDANGQMTESNGKVVLENLANNVLEDKTDDSSFNSYLVFNRETGKFAKSSRPQIVSTFNVPDNLSVTLNENISNIVFTRKQEYSQDIIDALSFIRSIGSLNFTKFKTSEIITHYIADEDLPEAILNDAERKRIIQNLFTSPVDGLLTYNGSYGKNFEELYNSDYYNQMLAKGKKSIATVLLNKEFPIDKDWCINFKSDQFRFQIPNYKVAFSDEPIVGNDYKGSGFLQIISTEGYNFRNTIYGSGGKHLISQPPNNEYEIWLIKKGNIFIRLIQTKHDGRYHIDVGSYDGMFRYIYIYLPLFKNGDSLVSSYTYSFNLLNICYWTQP